ncbi:MAG: hypothetical protein Q9214_002114 [Letrouitia sp. 1 TL-2023]
MNSKQSSSFLLHVLRTHGTGLGVDDVQWAFDGESTHDHVTSWVEQHLGQDTLLSVEEAQLFSKLQSNGTVQNVTRNDNLSGTTPFTDGSYRDALNSLEASTQTIEEQTRELEQRLQAISVFQERNRQLEVQWRKVAAQHHKKRLLEKQVVELANEELFRTSSSQIQQARSMLGDARNSLPSKMDSHLKADDRTLTKLDQLASNIELDTSDEKQSTQEIERLCSRLAGNRVNDLHYRLDRIYLESLHEFSCKGVRNITEDDQHEKSVKSELDSLYTEIPAVAEMSIAQEFAIPLSNAIAERIALAEETKKSTLDHVYKTTKHLSKTAHCILQSLEAFNAHRRTIEQISAELTKLESKSARQKVQSPSKHTREKHNLGERMIVPEAATTEVQRLLDTYGLSQSDLSDISQLESTLNAVVRDRERKMTDSLQHMDDCVTRSITAHLNEASQTQRLLLDAVLADSSGHHIEFFDMGLSRRLRQLETEIEDLGPELANLDLDRLEQQKKDRDAFVTRWKDPEKVRII